MFMRSFVFLFVLLASPAWGQNALPGMANNKEPIDISADTSLEWDQAARTYTARGNAVATRGPTSIASDLLTAHERDTTKDGKKATEVWKMTAEGNVKITSGTGEKQTVITGERGAYDMDRDVAVLTGNDLRLVSQHDTLTAAERFEYWPGKRLAIATGNAEVIRAAAGDTGERRIKADTMNALFREDANGEMVAERMEADGNVTIITATDVAKGDHAVYDMDKNKAIITGNVFLTRGKNQLAGDKAEVDFKTGLSKLVNTKQGGKRVRGLLYPDGRMQMKEGKAQGDQQ